MKRSTPLIRSTPLSRGKPLKRRTPINPANKKRRAARRAVTFGERGALVRGMPCLCKAYGAIWSGSACDGAIEAAHVRSRGAGGTRRDLVPLCERHHREQHQRGIESFSTRYSLNLPEHAARIARELDAQGVP